MKYDSIVTLPLEIGEGMFPKAIHGISRKRGLVIYFNLSLSERAKVINAEYSAKGMLLYEHIYSDWLNEIRKYIHSQLRANRARLVATARYNCHYMSRANDSMRRSILTSNLRGFDADNLTTDSMLYNHTIVPWDESKHSQKLLLWLWNAHYPYAIDRKRGRIIIFNMTIEATAKMCRLFHLDNYIYSQGCKVPDEYIGLLEYFGPRLCNNIKRYYYWACDSVENNFPNYSTLRNVAQQGFANDTYEGWNTRYYLSEGLRGIDSETKEVTMPNFPKDHADAVEEITQRAVLGWGRNQAGECPDAVGEILIDPDLKRAYAGVFATNHKYMDTPMHRFTMLKAILRTFREINPYIGKYPSDEKTAHRLTELLNIKGYRYFDSYMNQ